MGKMFFNILATFAEFEADLIRIHTREAMAIARAKEILRGKHGPLMPVSNSDYPNKSSPGRPESSGLRQ